MASDGSPPYAYCPVCGRSLERPDREGGARCPSCERSWYRNSAPTVGCVIVRDGKALVTVRAFEPEKGKIDLPGGFLAHGETPFDGLRRELREELGIEVEAGVEDCVQMATHRYGPAGDYNLSLGFQVRWVSGEPSPSDDVADIRWVGLDEIDDLDFAWKHNRELVRKVLSDG